MSLSYLRTTLALVALCSVALPAQEIPSGPSTITLIDGRELAAEVLFSHPNAPLVVLRSPHHRGLQSLPLTIIHRVVAGRQQTQVNARRPLKPDEAQELERNGLWVDEVGTGQIGHYAKQAWQARPALVWRHPGQTGDGQVAENWLDETGRPIAAMPWAAKADGGGIFDGDVLAPAADSTYEILQPGHRDHLPYYVIRHLTVERKAHYRLHYHIRGNLWVKDGALLGKDTQIGMFGGGDDNTHAVMRFCNWHDIAKTPQWAYAENISHWLRINSGKQGSLEVVGLTYGPSDRITLQSGTLIISENSYLGCGNRAAFYTMPESTVVLLDGARIGCPDPLKGGRRAIATVGIGGTLMFGMPQRPLTRDLEFSVNYSPLDQMNTSGEVNDRTSGGSLVLGAQGRMEVHSADPQKARVIFRPRDKTLPISQYVLPRELWHFVRGGPELQLTLWEQPGIAQGIIAVFRGKTNFDGVVFDGFYAGGIVVDPQAAAAWRNVTFGDNNLAPSTELFRAP